MKTVICLLQQAILLLAMAAPLSSYSQYQDLFRIVDNGKIGYMNDKGEIVIPPKYLNGGEFTNGLAPVRLNGLYGYINENNSFVIEPQFDFAYSFYMGIASVYKNGKQYIIDKNNQQFIDTAFKGAYFKNYNHAIVFTKSRHYGVMNFLTKKLIVDTIYDKIDNFRNGAARVMIKNTEGKNDRNYYSLFKYGVIDSMGKQIVPFDKYEYIGDFIDGISLVKIKCDSMGYPLSQGAINEKGELLFQRATTEDCYLAEEFHDGLAVVYFNRFSDKEYNGYITLKGEVVYSDSLPHELNDFSCRRTFVPNHTGGFRIVDPGFNIIGADTFTTYLNGGFINNYAIVRKNNIGWGMVDTNGKFIPIEGYDYEVNNHDEQTMVKGNYFFYEAEDNNGNNVNGVTDLSGNGIVQPIIQDYDRTGFKNGLLKAVVNNRLTYIDTLGNLVWQEKKMPDKTLKTYDIDYMNRGYFYAYSKPHRGDLGGYGGSVNIPRVISQKAIFAPNKLSVLVKPDEVDSIDVNEEDYYKAITIYVSNTTKNDIEFDAQDSRLYMNVQAKDASGAWKDIEYLPSSWCGNSYHILTLDKGNYWKFLTPVYAGSFKTKFRIELKYIDPDNSDDSEDKKILTVYSNEYDGSINPAQFWRKLNYLPNGIMDPYND